VKTFPWQQGIAGGIISYLIHVLSRKVADYLFVELVVYKGISLSGIR
jgi:hypothetical protein